MATKVRKSVEVEVPVETAYNQWTQFEEFPHFMDGISEVRQLDETTLQWTAVIAGVKREWKAKILEQVPDQKVAWAATEGATNAGAVYFASLSPTRTTVTLELEYEPEGIVEKVADKANLVDRRAEGDLEKFKSFIEDEGYAGGAWRGTVPGTGSRPTVEDAAASKGDSGSAGVAKKVIAGAAVAAAAGAAAVAKSKSGDSETETAEVERDVTVVETESTPRPATSTEPAAVDPLADDIGRDPRP